MAAVLLALAATSLCAYRFGAWDQGQYLVQVVSIEDSAGLAGDPYLEAFGALGSVFWRIAGALTSEAGRAWGMLLMTLACASCAAAALMRLGRDLLGDGASVLAMSAFALVLAAPKEQNWFGLVSLSDVEMTATLAATPIVTLVMLLAARGRIDLAFLASAAAAFVQGQTAAYLLSACWLFAALAAWRRRDRGMMAGLAATACVGACGLAVFVLQSRVGPESLDAYERVGMGLYAELIDIRAAPLRSWLSMVGVLALGASAAAGVWRMGGFTGATGATGRRLAMWGAASLAFPVCGVALLWLGVREPALWKLMVGRGFMLPQFVALAFVAWWCVLAMRRGTWLGASGGVVLTGAALWPLPSMGAWWAGILLCAMCAAMALGPRFRNRWSPVRTGRLGLTLSWGAVMLAAIAAFVERPYAWLASADDPAWIEAQHWARANTSTNAMFVTPPYLSGWRLWSHRRTWGEVKDGCLLFYAGDAAVDWLTRMERVGVDASALTFHEAGQPRSRLASQRAGYAAALTDASWLRGLGDETYVVVERGTTVPCGRAVWRGAAFEIWDVHAE